MFKCEICGGNGGTYDFTEHAYKCPDCGDVVPAKAREITCPRCFTRVTSYAWFDPPSCKCGQSFLD